MSDQRYGDGYGPGAGTDGDGGYGYGYGHVTYGGDSLPYDPYNPTYPQPAPTPPPARGVRGAASQPLNLARRFGTPDRPGAVEDRTITALQSGRTLLGLGATVWLVFAYPLRQGREEFVMGKVEDLLVAAGFAVVAILVAATLFIGLADASLRGLYLRRAVQPLGTLLALAVGAGVVWLCWYVLREGLGLTDNQGAFLEVLFYYVLSFAAGLAALVGVLVGLLYTIALLVYAVNSCFRAGAIHELLPPVLSPVLLWGLAVLQYFDDAAVAAPPAVLHAFMLGAPLSVTALSVWELRRLRTRHGMTFRGALGRG
ncbi:hypothetical protein [Streptomyces venezuelae]|uniref:Uncharacterized protein n=1 Tax=Streptomyces venezuelae TaxID=54571 RepID=A0A5P2BVB7_STRVZ|nr:hypothetical protein [Streptomyces venezuelae]QES34442.1 hypothetical protein DEJ48_14475 [Streptomyces venezuelae]